MVSRIGLISNVIPCCHPADRPVGVSTASTQGADDKKEAAFYRSQAPDASVFQAETAQQDSSAGAWRAQRLQVVIETMAALDVATAYDVDRKYLIRLLQILRIKIKLQIKVIRIRI